MSTEPRRSERTFTIRQLCLEFKCTPRALRFYEDKGLLAPARQGLNRIYSHRDRARLQIILRGKLLNLSLAEIREILDHYNKDDGGVAQSAVALRRYRKRLVTLEKQRRDLDIAIDELRSSCERIEARLAEARPDLLAGSQGRASHPELASVD